MPAITVTYYKARVYKQDADELFKEFPALKDLSPSQLEEFIKRLVIARESRGRGKDLFNHFTPVETPSGWKVEIPPLNDAPKRTAKRSNATPRRRAKKPS
jgi:hypothetical protein